MKPLLAASIKDLKDIRYPVICSPKIDGIRCLIQENGAVSRKLKPIPNLFVREKLKDLPVGLDGELISGNFQETSSAVMRIKGEPSFEYHVFDYVKDPLEPYQERLKKLYALECGIIKVPTFKIENENQLLQLEKNFLKEGYEGVMLRDPKGVYKQGRSTLKEGILLKLKRFSDSEAEILDLEEALHNENLLEEDALGYAKRSSAKEGKILAGYLGSLKVRDFKSGIEFGIGSGFTLDQRKEIWKDKDLFKKKIVKYKYQAAGVKEAPRFPVFLGFRED